MTIFVDASASVSYFDCQDQNHLKAVALSKRFGRNEIVISNYVFAETVTILSQNAGKEVATDAGNYIQTNFSIIRVSPEMENLAWEIFKKQKSKNVSFVDCTTFALYQDGAFDKALTFDSDFKSNKVPILE